MNAHSVRRTAIRPVVISEPLESRLLFARVEGIDVSQFQGVIDWNAVAANGKQFVFMRSSRTNLDKDPTFDTNLAGATAAGLLVGAYHFTLPNSFGEAGPMTDPVADAQKFVAAGGAAMQTGNLRPVIDSEAGSTLGKTGLSNWVNAFSREIERLTGVVPIVYANINYAVNFLNTSVAARHDLWLARYNNGNDPSGVDPQTSQPDLASFHPNPYGSWNVPVGGPRSDSAWSFWQYTSSGDGIATGVSSTDLDLNLFNGDYATLKRNFVIGEQKNFGKGAIPFAVGPDLTTTIQFEDYDDGGQGISYNDTTSDVNTGNIYRANPRSGVDVRPLVGGVGQYVVADAQPGEWTEYTINVTESGTYRFNYRVANSTNGGTFHVDFDGQSQDPIEVPDTDGFGAFAEMGQNVFLSAGEHIVRVNYDSLAPGNNVVGEFDRITVNLAPPPEPEPEPLPEPEPEPAPTGLGFAAYVRGGLFAPQNFGASTELLVQRGKSSRDTSWSYLQFDLTALSSVASAKLRLTGRLSDEALPSLTTNVYAAAATKRVYAEDGLTWKKKLGAKKLQGAITVTGTTPGAYELDLTPFVQTELAAGRKIVTLVLKNITKSVTTATVFDSDDTTNPPALVTT